MTPENEAPGRIRDDAGTALIRRIKRSSVVLLVLVAAGSGAVFGKPSIELGVLAGGIAAIVNFRWLEAAVQKTLTDRPDDAVGRTIRRWLVRYFVAGGLLYGACQFGRAGVLAVFVGLNVVVLAVMVEGIRFMVLSFRGNSIDA